MKSCGQILGLIFSLLLLGAGEAVSQATSSAAVEIVRLQNGEQQIGLDTAHGTLFELAHRAEGFNEITPSASPCGLWQLTIQAGDQPVVIDAQQLPAPQIKRAEGPAPEWRLCWEYRLTNFARPLRVEATIRLGQEPDALSYWNLAVEKPTNGRLQKVSFPRLSGLRARTNEVLAVPTELGQLAHNPRALLAGTKKQGTRLSWRAPFRLSVSCLAWYQENGPGFYAAADDTQGYWKDFALWGDKAGAVGFEVTHEPEQEGVGLGEFHLPFRVVLGTFRGDWNTAAQIYRASPASQLIAQRGRLARHLTPAWLEQTGLWLWNRGRSPQVLEPAIALRQHTKTPVSVLWHWWHNCPYDAGFPEYLPPREGAESFQSALAAAHKQDVHAILYMNQRLWGTQTRSWTNECAENFAVRKKDGTVSTEVYNKFMNAPCAPMCIGTAFWRNRYAGLAQAAFGDLGADGVYMDQTGTLASCYDARHGHIAGPGRYWIESLNALAAEIRDRSSGAGKIALGGEYCGEPWLGSVDLSLGLSVAADRMGSPAAWEPIPFLPAVYHGSTIIFGNMAGLAYPPYDEKWPPALAPTNALQLLDRKFSRQFYLEQARTFVWGMQPMLANFSPGQIKTRPEEIDYVTRLARTRSHALKYLLHGTWLRPPEIASPRQEIDVAKLGTYTPIKASQRTAPTVLTGAWRAADNGVAIALASIVDEKLSVRLPLAADDWGLARQGRLYRIDETGRHRLGAFEPSNNAVPIELRPREIALIEFCQEK